MNYLLFKVLCYATDEQLKQLPEDQLLMVLREKEDVDWSRWFIFGYNRGFRKVVELAIKEGGSVKRFFRKIVHSYDAYLDGILRMIVEYGLDVDDGLRIAYKCNNAPIMNHMVEQGAEVPEDIKIDIGEAPWINAKGIMSRNTPTEGGRMRIEWYDNKLRGDESDPTIPLPTLPLVGWGES